MLDFHPPRARRPSTAVERLWVLGAALAVILPILFLARATRGGREQPPGDRGGAVPASSAGRTPEPLPADLQIAPALLDTIRDNTLERPEERPAFLRLLEILQRATPGQLERASMGRITYAQLLRQPNQYRGRLVTIRGTVRRVSRAEPPRNQQGLQHYYQLWIEPDDAPSWTIVVVCLDLPRGFPVGLEVAEEAEITGFFFKRWAYMARDQLRTAPALLARTIGWESAAQPTPASPPGQPIPWTSVLIAGVGALVIGAWVVWRWRGRPPRHALPTQPAPDFSHLHDRSSTPDPKADP